MKCVSGLTFWRSFVILVPLVDYIFLTTFYGLYFNHQLHITIAISSSSYMFMVTFCEQLYLEHSNSSSQSHTCIPHPAGHPLKCRITNGVRGHTWNWTNGTPGRWGEVRKTNKPPSPQKNYTTVVYFLPNLRINRLRNSPAKKWWLIF